MLVIVELTVDVVDVADEPFVAVVSEDEWLIDLIEEVISSLVRGSYYVNTIVVTLDER